MNGALERADVSSAIVIGNYMATKFNGRDFGQLVSNLGVPHDRPVLIGNGEDFLTNQRELDRRLTLAGKRQGVTAIIVVGGDGTLQKTLQEVCDRELLPKAVLVHVPQGDFNVQKEIFGTTLKDVKRVIKDGMVLRVDLMNVLIEGAFYSTPINRVGLLAIGGNDAILLKRMEEARVRFGRLTRIEKLQTVRRSRNEIQPIAVRVSTKHGVIFNRKTLVTETVNGGPKLLGVKLAEGTVFDGIHKTIVIPAETREEGINRTVLAALCQICHIPPPPSWVQWIPSSEVTIEYASAVPVHVDAEVEKDLVEKMTITSLPRAARFLVSATRPGAV